MKINWKIKLEKNKIENKIDKKIKNEIKIRL